MGEDIKFDKQRSIEFRDSYYSRCTQMLNKLLPASDFDKFFFWAKGTTGSIIQARFHYTDGTYGQCQFTITTTDWTLFGITSVPSGKTIAKVELDVRNDGLIWIDDVELLKRA